MMTSIPFSQGQNVYQTSDTVYNVTVTGSERTARCGKLMVKVFKLIVKDKNNNCMIVPESSLG